MRNTILRKAHNKYGSFQVSTQIDDKFVYVSGSSTCFADAKSVPTIDREEFKSNLKELKAKAKTAGCKLFVGTASKFFEENYKAYLADLFTYNLLFASYKNAWEEILDKNLDISFSPEVIKAKEIQNQMDKMFWRSKLLSKMRSIDNEITINLNRNLSGCTTLRIN